MRTFKSQGAYQKKKKNSISIYDLDDEQKYSFIAKVHNPCSHETRGDKDYKCDRLLLKDVIVFIDNQFRPLTNECDNDNIIRIDLGKKLKNLELEEYDLLSFDAKIRMVPSDDYFGYTKMGEVIKSVDSSIHFSNHLPRKCWAYHLYLANNEDITIVQAALGHTNSLTTTTYIGLDKKTLKKKLQAYDPLG